MSERDHSTCNVYEPFEIEWGIFPAEMRADAEAAAAGGILFALTFITANLEKALSNCEIDFEHVVAVPFK